MTTTLPLCPQIHMYGQDGKQLPLASLSRTLRRGWFSKHVYKLKHPASFNHLLEQLNSPLRLEQVIDNIYVVDTSIQPPKPLARVSKLNPWTAATEETNRSTP